MSRIPHCLDNRLTDGGYIFSPTRRPRCIPRNTFWCSFLPKATVRLEGLGKMKRFSNFIRPLTFRLVATMPQPTTLPHIIIIRWFRGQGSWLQIQRSRDLFRALPHSLTFVARMEHCISSPCSHRSAIAAHSEPEESSYHALRLFLHISLCKHASFPKQFQLQVRWPVSIRNCVWNYESCRQSVGFLGSKQEKKQKKYSLAQWDSNQRSECLNRRKHFMPKTTATVISKMYISHRIIFKYKLQLLAGLGAREYGRRDPPRWPHGTLYPQKLALTSPTSSGLLVGIVRSRTQATEF
jgi:hypothetical protein